MSALQTPFTEPFSSRRSLKETNKLAADDHAAHDWYRFVLSFPAHLVRDYLAKFGADAATTVLDPFCGTGTTVVECKKLGIPSIGIEINPIAQFAAATKVDWSLDADAFLRHASTVAEEALARLIQQDVRDTPSATGTPWIEGLPL